MARILAADLGGTNSRFGYFEADGHEVRLVETRHIPSESVRSFPELLDILSASGFALPPEKADAVALAVAGVVQNGVFCRLTNASWSVDLRLPGLRLPVERTVLMNDFVAQAFGCRTAVAGESAVWVQRGTESGGVVAVMGAGTGFGQCALMERDGKQHALPSEGSHAPSAFVTPREFELSRFISLKTGYSHVFNDVVLSGRGLSLVHEFLTGRSLEPAEVAAEAGPDTETAAWFARLYGRACRAYVLHVLALGGLDICGGVAGKNPHFVTHPDFLDEFTDSPAHGDLLRAVPVRLITEPDTGLLGAAAYGARLLTEKQGGA
jgi:glucokinase